MNKFYAEVVKDECVQWIRDWFEKNGEGCNAIVGISGGKDSSVVAALCVEALGKDRVIGVLMPNGTQGDIQDAYKLVEHLNIKYCEVNIHDTVQTLLNNIDAMYNPERDGYEDIAISEQTTINLPPRVRMATLYAVSQSCNGRVANTCNLSEDYVGYSTRYGDNAGDFSPLSNLTVGEVKAIGRELGLPAELIDKTPSDGLCGKTDEDNLGFTYDVLDTYIRTGEIDTHGFGQAIKDKIDSMHEKNLFKLQLMPNFKPSFLGQNVVFKGENMILKNWSVCMEGDSFTAPELRSKHLQGNVYGHPNFTDGTFVTTSSIVDLVDKGTHKEAITHSGSIYELYKDDVDPECENKYPNYYVRLKICEVQE